MQKEGPITYFAQTDSRAKRVPFGIKAHDRSRHMYVIGKTGMGKSTLLENMAVQDIQNGNGFAFIDPHGASAEKLLDYIPEERAKDVLYFAPFDLQYPVAFNVLEKVVPDHRHLVVNGLMSTFEKLWEDQWSARMAYILQNTLAALLEFPGATLLGVNRMYVDKDYRKSVVDNCSDPTVQSFWREEYAKYTDRYTQEATPAIQNKIGQFQANSLVRNIIGQSESTFNLREMMDTRKIFIMNLSKGRVGEGNANLLGSMLITKLYLAAMSRADVPMAQLAHLPEMELYVDEFQNFANRSFADILSESRKYKLALTIAHQYIEQMEEEVAAAVFGNVGTMVAFRVGAYDAEVLEKEFMPTFTGEDLVNLGARQIYLKLMIDGVSSQPFSATTLPPIEQPRVSMRDKVIAHSRARYSRPRAEVEREIREWTLRSFAPAKEVREKNETGKSESREKREQKEAPDGAPKRADVRAPSRIYQERTHTEASLTPRVPPAQASVVSKKASEISTFSAPQKNDKAFVVRNRADFDTYAEQAYFDAYAMRRNASPQSAYNPPTPIPSAPQDKKDIARVPSDTDDTKAVTRESLREVLKRVAEDAARIEAKRVLKKAAPAAPPRAEEKEDLRTALARVVAQAPKTAQVKPTDQNDHADQSAQNTMPKEKSVVASTPPEITPEDIRRMMAMKKPKV